MYKTVKIKHLIDGLEKELLWDKDHISDIMSIDSNILSTNGSLEDLPFKSLANLSTFIGVSLENIFQNNIDYSVIKKRFFNSSVAIPDKYLVGAGTYIGTFRNFYHYIKNKYNTAEATEMINHFQITKEALVNDNVLVNILLINEILDYCHNHLNFTEEDLRLLSFRSYVDGKTKQLLALKEMNLSGKEILRNIVNQSNKYENNFNYSFEEISEKKYLIRSESKDEINDELSRNVISSDLNNLYKKLLIEALPALLNQTNVSIKNISTANSALSQNVEYYVEDI